jgi:hypothetical protein
VLPRTARTAGRKCLGDCAMMMPPDAVEASPGGISHHPGAVSTGHDKRHQDHQISLATGRKAPSRTGRDATEGGRVKPAKIPGTRSAGRWRPDGESAEAPIQPYGIAMDPTLGRWGGVRPFSNGGTRRQTADSATWRASQADEGGGERGGTVQVDGGPGQGSRRRRQGLAGRGEGRGDAAKMPERPGHRKQAC